MTREQPDPEGQDPLETIRHRYPRPNPSPRHDTPPRQSQEPPATVRLPYTPDMLPDVPLYEAKPPRSAWWWVIVAGTLVLLIAAVAVAAVLWGRASADAAPRALQAGVELTPG
ncbi:hypothetical protein [Nonomuraea sp. NPDC050786]|uniref:hypothetical protein n=1 Tax=Nonomuraea sp. NPDC050786 TaxID=3154840 RepID=UPI0034031D6C